MKQTNVRLSYPDKFNSDEAVALVNAALAVMFKMDSIYLNRVETIVERVYSTRYDCAICPV